MPAGRPLVVAHRGDSSGVAENSPEAFEMAVEAGADMIEFDVRRTGDGHLIACHDDAIGGRAVASLTHRQVTAALGRRPPLLTELLDQLRGRIGLNIEIKENGLVEPVLDAVQRRFNTDEVILTSFLEDTIRTARDAAPELRAGLLLAREQVDGPDVSRERTRACASSWVALEAALVARDGLDWANDEGLKVLVWTVNDAGLIRELFANPCVAGVITDFPARALALRDETPRG
jgi:glycerophosphoryl diester phosphodiesterase